MFSLVTVPDFLVTELPVSHLEDLDTYFESDIYLIPDATDADIPGTLADVTGGPVVAPRLLSQPTKFTGEDDVVVIVSYPDQLEKLEGTTFDQPVHIVTGFLEQEYNYANFSCTISYLDEYRRTIQSLFAPTITHSTIEAPAGETLTTAELDGKIHGLNWVEGQPQNPTRYIPQIQFNPEGKPSVEHLRSDRLGLQAIYQLGSKYRERLVKNGITNREDIIEAEPRELLEISGIGAHTAAAYISTAHAIADKTIYQFDSDPISDEQKLFIDIETDSLSPSIIWQIGVYNNMTGDYIAFLQKDPSTPHEIIRTFGDWLVEREGSALVAWNGPGFDYPCLETFISEYGKSEHRKAWNSISKYDMKQDVLQKCAAVPARSWGLSTVAKHLGYTRTHPELSGEDAAETYLEWQSGGEEPDWEMWRQYCKDDVLAMKFIYDAIRQADSVIMRSTLEEIASNADGDADAESDTDHSRMQFEPTDETVVADGTVESIVGDNEDEAENMRLSAFSDNGPRAGGDDNE